MIEPHTLVDNDTKIKVFNTLFPAMQRIANLVWQHDEIKPSKLMQQESSDIRRVLREHDILDI